MRAIAIAPLGSEVGENIGHPEPGPTRGFDKAVAIRIPVYDLEHKRSNESDSGLDVQTSANRLSIFSEDVSSPLFNKSDAIDDWKVHVSAMG